MKNNSKEEQWMQEQTEDDEWNRESSRPTRLKGNSSHFDGSNEKEY